MEMIRNQLALVFIHLSFIIVAQKPSKQMVEEMVMIISDHIETNYVLPEKGKEIVAYFKSDHKKGRFLELTTFKKLDSVMCKSLKEASNDNHLYVWHNYDLVKQLQSQKEETDNEGGEETTTFFNNEKAYKSNFGFDKVEILEDNIGYIKLSQINISEHSLQKLYAAFHLVRDTDALIIDIRNNGGGGSTIGSVLETYFFDRHTDLLEFKSRNGETSMNSTVGWLLEDRYLKPLYILTNKHTGSAAEAFAFALKNHNRCTIVGQASSGGAYMNSYFPVNDHFVIAISTSAPFIPGTNQSWEGEGVQPDYVVDEKEALSKAVQLIKSN